MSTDIGAIMQLLQRQMALVPPAYSAVSSPPQVVTQHTHVRTDISAKPVSGARGWESISTVQYQVIFVLI